MFSSNEMFMACDLSWLILRPEIVENGLSMAYRLGRVVIGDETNIRMSSAKRMHLCSLSPHAIPLTSSEAHIFIASGSNASTKSNGDSGQP